MISGYTITRDCVLHDYCFEECIRSMLPFCDEVVVGDAMSRDGTRERALAIDSRVRIVDCPRHENIFGQRDFIALWMSFTREHLSGDYQFYLDADEVCGQETGQWCRTGRIAVKALWCKRLNFGKSTNYLFPDGTVCASRVIRSGPIGMFMPVDCTGIHPRENEWESFPSTSGISIFHYGFLRERSAYYRKCRFLQPALVGDHDPRLVAAERDGSNWIDKYPELKLVPYVGLHPEIAIPWLRERGYNPRTQ